jgi:hypothetical protein
MKVVMDKVTVKTLCLGFMFAILVATAPTWLNSGKASANNYDAPWMTIQHSQ